MLDRLLAGGATVLYSGDLDVGGLRIARGLVRQYGAAVRLWRYDVISYRLALATGGRPFTDVERTALVALQADFPDLVEAMLAEGRAAYQEALTMPLLSDTH